MISRAKFHGGARFHSIAVPGNYDISWAWRLHRVSNGAVAGVVMVLPSALNRTLGGTHFIITCEGTSLQVARKGEAGSPSWTIPAGYRGCFHLVENGNHAGRWVVDIRQSSLGRPIPKLEAAVVGGSGDTTGVLRLQNATDTFIAGATAPNGRMDASSFQNRNELFVAGAIGITGSSTKLDGYKSDTWRHVGNLPIAHGGGFGGFAIGRGFLFGGVDEVRTRAFHQHSETWSERASMGFQRSLGAAATVDGKIYIISGSPALSPSVCYTPLLDCFSVLPGYSGINRRRQSGFGLMGKVYSCGGIDDTVGTHDLVDVLDVRSLSWSVGPPIPMGGRSGGGAFQSNRRGYFGGGRDGAAANQLDAATLRAGTWVGLAAFGSARYGVGCSSGAAL